MSGHTSWSAIEHKADAAPQRLEFSCSPWAPLPLDGHADAMDAMLDALRADGRALDAGSVGYDDRAGLVSSTFQVEAGSFAEAVDAAAAVFDDALRAADVDEITIGVSVVAGGPELLP